MAKADLLHGNQETQFRSGSDAARVAQMKSVQSKRRNCDIRKLLQSLLSMPIGDGTQCSLDDVASLGEAEGLNLSVGEQICLAQIRKAVAGDTKAFLEIMRLVDGEKYHRLELQKMKLENDQLKLRIEMLENGLATDQELYERCQIVIVNDIQEQLKQE